MDTSSANSIHVTPDPSLLLQRVDARAHQAALALLLTGRAQANTSEVEQFLWYARQQQVVIDELWLAQRHGKPIAAVLCVPGAGRTAMVFLSPIPLEQVGVAARLIDQVMRAQSPQKVALAQALLEPQHPVPLLAFEQAGFQRLAGLLYMQRVCQTFAGKLVLPPDITAHHWTGNNRHLFAQAITASYQQTADCPGLVGLRHIEDVIDGHIATGLFTPQLWTLLLHHGQGVGVLLLNQTAQRNAIELVYLGLAPAIRGQGLARRLMMHGLTLAAQQGLSPMLLAVDDTNQPALKLYKSLDFTPTGHKIALIRSLSDASAATSTAAMSS